MLLLLILIRAVSMLRARAIIALAADTLASIVTPRSIFDVAAANLVRNVALCHSGLGGLGGLIAWIQFESIWNGYGLVQMLRDGYG